MTRMGSLSGGVASCSRSARPAPPCSACAAACTGWSTCSPPQLDRFDVDVVTGAEVTGLGSHVVAAPTQLRMPRPERGGGSTPSWPARPTTRPTLSWSTPRTSCSRRPRRRRAACSTPRRSAGRMSSDWPPAASVELVTLVLDAPALDAAPRGTGVLVAAGTPGVTAKALTHSTAKWPWLAELAGGRHVVRLSYGRAGEPNPLDGRTDARGGRPRARRRERHARHAARPVVGARASGRSAWRDALSQATIGQRDRVRALEDVLAAEPGIEATGSWVAGTGLASVDPARDRGGAPHPAPRGHPGRHRIAETEYSRATPLRDPARGLRLERSLW